MSDKIALKTPQQVAEGQVGEDGGAWVLLYPALVGSVARGRAADIICMDRVQVAAWLRQKAEEAQREANQHSDQGRRDYCEGQAAMARNVAELLERK